MAQVTLFIVFFFISLINLKVDTEGAQLAPAAFIFGDSLVDVGNNNYLKLSLAKADFPHNGVDYPGQKATGRFCNGKNAADFLAEKLGLASPPPYLAVKSMPNKSEIYLTGVSFASGGAGIFNGTDDLYKQSIPLTKQVDFYISVYQDLVQNLGSTEAQNRLSKSIFTIVIGSNDVFGYVSSDSSLGKNSTPQQYADSMTSSLKDQLKRLHGAGARKFVVSGVGAVGCCPSQRLKNKTQECNADANNLAQLYNADLKPMLQGLKTELGDISYSYFDAYGVFQTFLQTPAKYGFTETKAACCGLGTLNAKVACLPISSYCSDRDDHVFWDLYHPTQAAASILADDIFDGTSQYTYPVNARELVAV
ncbi:GDSL lipase/esterase [Dillenia turbinata]|uniref:GDSL lipase/esterase n=1 Tax=Dillenia turbinata TaxID=194707 RepID=A0AAN8VI24_9MAGN